MCTITLRRLPQSLLLTMNRDELHSRAPEQPPSIQQIDDTRWLAPRDGEAGGTWIAVNEHGLSACLHNGHVYAATPEQHSGQSNRPSRGGIIPHCMPFSSVAEACDHLAHRFDPAAYAAFTLILADRKETIATAWDEHELRIAEHTEQWLFFASSGAGDGATEWRRGKFLEWIEEGELYNNGIPDFHLLHDPDHPDLSPLMSTPRSSTRSITQVQIDWSSQSIAMRYIPIDNTSLAAPEVFVM